MIDFIKSLVTVADPKESIDAVVRRMAKQSQDVLYSGIVVVLDKKGVLLGVVTDGDIRRSYARNISFFSEIAQIMVKDPITISERTVEALIPSEVVRKVQLDERLHAEWVRYVLVIDDNNRLTNVIDYIDVLQNSTGLVNRVAVIGMGYVGLTLAVSLANRGHQVTGIDIQRSLIDALNKGNPHILEPGLLDILKANLERKSIEFCSVFESVNHQVYIVAVGTPLDAASKPNLLYLIEALSEISKVLKKGNQVILRSTVPVGVTRDIVIPYLEEKTGLIAGEDFYVSFSPERTIEGMAMHELKTLPQIVSGYSLKCTQMSAEFWSTLTPTVVRVDSLEAAEMVKLANNTFRDISFSFANELALLADNYNVNAFKLINAANEGYPRNKIPTPSPGVGGYCLTKDPILFSCTADGLRPDAVLGIASRTINKRAAMYPAKLIEKYVTKKGILISECNVLILGVAFKGVPETADIRGSVAFDIKDSLSNSVKRIIACDAVVSPEELHQAGFEATKNISEIMSEIDVVLILNNHPDNIRSEIYSPSSKGRLLFDGWHQYDAAEIESIPGLEYATMGYMTE